MQSRSTAGDIRCMSVVGAVKYDASHSVIFGQNVNFLGRDVAKSRPPAGEAREAKRVEIKAKAEENEMEKVRVV